MKDMLRAALLALPKNPRRNHLRFYCIITAETGTPNQGRRPKVKHIVCPKLHGAQQVCRMYSCQNLKGRKTMRTICSLMPQIGDIATLWRAHPGALPP
jgi:hypothetical protein